VLRQYKKASNGPGVRIGIERKLLGQLFETIARSYLTPAGRLMVKIEKVAVKFSHRQQLFPQISVFGCASFAPTIPTVDPPGNAITPTSVTPLIMYLVEIFY
jgi:hypothetical protein